MVTRAGHNPAIAGQVHSDQASLGSQSDSQDQDQQGPSTSMAVANLETGKD